LSSRISLVLSPLAAPPTLSCPALLGCVSSQVFHRKRRRPGCCDILVAARVKSSEAESQRGTLRPRSSLSLCVHRLRRVPPSLARCVGRSRPGVRHARTEPAFDSSRCQARQEEAKPILCAGTCRSGVAIRGPGLDRFYDDQLFLKSVWRVSPPSTYSVCPVM
jgi:hypothetical protein